MNLPPFVCRVIGRIGRSHGLCEPITRGMGDTKYLSQPLEHTSATPTQIQCTAAEYLIAVPCH
jgi:hypothetical protein